MARTVAQIKHEIGQSFVASPAIQSAYGLTPGLSFEAQFSAVSLESIFFSIVAVAIWSLEKALDISMSQQTQYIKDTKIHSLTWYADYAKRFQYGSALPWGEVAYDNSGLTPSQVAAQQVVKYAVAVKVPGGLRIKIAGADGSGNLQPISEAVGSDQLAPFKDYMFRISAAGDNLYYTNNQPDKLLAKIDIYYDPLVLDSAGARLDGTAAAPVPDAIEAFIKQMDFNGRFVPQDFVDWLQGVEGVKIANPTLLQTSYGLLPPSPVPAEGVVPDSGYLRIYNPATDLIPNYIIWTP